MQTQYIPIKNSSHYYTKQAETKVAQGIAQLLDHINPGQLDYDAQGIGSKFFPNKQLQEWCIASCFPQSGINGIRLHWFKKGYIKHPPLIYMLEQKLNSLISAAILFAANSHTLSSSFVGSIKEKYDIETIKKEKIFTSLAELTAEKFYKQAQQIMADYTVRLVNELYTAYACTSKQAISFDDFFKKIKTIAELNRFDAANILTVDEETGRISYEECFPSETSHNRKIGNKISNFSLVLEGEYKKLGQNYVVDIVVSLFKHASLPPIKDIKHIEEKADIKVLMDTTNHIEEIIKAMAKWYLHGCDKNNKIIDIDWVYELLTSNAFNIDKQSYTYSYIVEAMHLMSGVTIILENGQKVNFTGHVLNAGLNKLANFKYLQNSFVQRYENANSFLHLSLALIKNELIYEEMLSDKRLTQNMKRTILKLIKQPENKSQALYDELLQSLNNEVNNFSNIRDQYNKALKENALNNVLINQIKLVRSRVRRVYEELNEIAKQIDKSQRDDWHDSSTNITHGIFLLLEIFKNDNLDTDRLSALSALVYKSQLNSLYYSGQYQEPKNAMLFNAYLVLYQRALGLIPSVGCKSANDRTYVQRCAVAILAALPLAKITTLLKNETLYQYFLTDFSKVEMSISAMFSAIADTNGGAPKVNANKFPFLAGVDAVNWINTFGKFAAHQLHVKERKSYSNLSIERKSEGSMGLIGLAVEEQMLEAAKSYELKLAKK